MSINADQVEWIVNSKGELGVKVFNHCFFLYKGYSLEYKETAPEIKYRPVGKREFGETCWPQHWVKRGYRDDNYELRGSHIQYIQGLSDGKPEDYEWRPLPVPSKPEEAFPLPDFSEPLVQTVYEILADPNLVPPAGEHWDGYAARVIIQSLGASASFLPTVAYRVDYPANAGVGLPRFFGRDDSERMNLFASNYGGKVTELSERTLFTFETPKEVTPVPRVNPHIPDPGSVWVHKNGNEYTVLMLTNQCSERQEEYPTTVVYQGSNGRVWSRPLVDWFRSMTPKEMKS